MDDICLEEIAPEMSSLASPIIPGDFSDLIEIDVSRFPGMDDLDSRLVWLLQKHADPTPAKKIDSGKGNAPRNRHAINRAWWSHLHALLRDWDRNFWNNRSAIEMSWYSLATQTAVC